MAASSKDGAKQALPVSTNVKSASKDKKNKNPTSKELPKELGLGKKPISASTNIFDTLNEVVGDEVDS